MIRHDITLDDLASALQYLDCTNSDIWVRAGMAIKSEFGEAGFDVWDNWSQGDDRYKPREARSRWKSFKGGSARGKVSIGTILHWAFERGFKIERPELTPEERERFAQEQEQRRAELAAKWAQEQADIERWYAVVADACQRLAHMGLIKSIGSSPYLGRKRIKNIGCFFPASPFLLDFKPSFEIDIITDHAAIMAVFARAKANKAAGREDDDAFVYVKRGAILIPLRDMAGQVRNLQIIYGDGKRKRFITNGQKAGLHALLGSFEEPGPLVFLEGYATGASARMATGWPVVVTFDAGNMPVVAELFANSQRPLLFAGDNDWETALEHGKKNIGLVKCQQAAAIAGGTWCVPQFAGDAKGLSDFNDLHVAEGLHVVKAQLEAALLQTASSPVAPLEDGPPDYSGVPPDYLDVPPHDESEVPQNHYPDERQQILGGKTVYSIDVLLKRFHFVVPSGAIWDGDACHLIKKMAFADLVGKVLAAEWREHPDRLSIEQSAVDSVLAAKARSEKAERMAMVDPWRRRFIYNDSGEIKADISNAKLVLENDSRWSGVLGYCDFSYRVLKRKKPPFANSDIGEWTDSDTDRLRIWLAEHYRFTPKTADALGAVIVAAEENRFHPVREYLRSLRWDGVSRLEGWLCNYLGAEFSAYSALVGKKFLIGAVARVMRPPVKMDNVLIFEGLQGIGKSTAIKILAGEWFTDTPLVLGDKDSFQQIQGVWIVELAELDSLNKAENTRAKQFFGSQVDRYRPSYGRLTQTFARQCVFAGSTNQDNNYLRDPTGNRRYWPVKCTKVDSVALARDRDQLWAEAVARYDRGDQWWPEESHKQLFEEQQEARFDADVWEELIEAWLMSTTKPRVLMSEIMDEALNLEPSQMKPPEQKRVGQIMAHLGWTKVRARVGSGRETGYEPPPGWKARGIAA